jgi:5-oxoprolinase (ATP-hydrolysing) subunit A
MTFAWFFAGNRRRNTHMRVDLNSDLGESFGAWKMGDDEAMLGIITSASVACGWHAGDPVVMHRAAELAKAKGVAIGAHPSFNDLWGFGRRVIRGTSFSDLEKQVAYQIGALQAVAAMVGHKVTHVKAHGALGNLVNDEDDFAIALARAMKAVDPTLVFVVMPGRPSVRAAEKIGVPMLQEIFADRAYTDNGQLVMRGQPGAMIHDVDIAAERILRALNDNVMISVTGNRVPVKIDSICVHGDTPTAVEMARQLRERLTAAGIELRPYTAP